MKIETFRLTIILVYLCISSSRIAMNTSQHMIVMNRFFLVNATLDNNNNTQMTRLIVHAYSLETPVMLLSISLIRIVISTILYWAWFRYIGLDTTTSKEVLRVMTYTRQMCLTCVWSSVMRSTYYQSHPTISSSTLQHYCIICY